VPVSQAGTHSWLSNWRSGLAGERLGREGMHGCGPWLSELGVFYASLATRRYINQGAGGTVMNSAVPARTRLHGPACVRRVDRSAVLPQSLV